jgi:hypothetical protein
LYKEEIVTYCGDLGGVHGIPIDDETQNLYSDELKSAWIKFDAWWKNTLTTANPREPIDRKSIPEDVKTAMDLILITPIPGNEEFTGADSSYMISVSMMMTDPE